MWLFLLVQNARMHTYMNKQQKIQELLTKGVAEILPNREFLESLLNKNKKLTIYAGFDPTAPTLHIGHTIILRKLRQFQNLGHQIIFLIGDFTARIGDPTDKSATRKQLTIKEIKTNLKLYKKQASKFISFTGPNAAKLKFNNSWLGKMKFADVLNLASLITVDQMLKRDMFAKRMEDSKPIYIHEFMYPLMQGYDSVAMDVDGEVGGNDQLFNMMMGRTLLKDLKNKEKFVVTTKLLEDGTGAKMGKTTGNMVSLMDDANNVYGKVMSWPDSLIILGFELCTDMSLEEIQKKAGALKGTVNPRDFKMHLAYEIVKSYTDEKTAQKAQDNFISTFQQHEIPSEIKKFEAKQYASMAEILIKEKVVSSNSELKRLADAGAIKNLETDKILDFSEVKSQNSTGVYKIGKNRFVRLF